MVKDDSASASRLQRVVDGMIVEAIANREGLKGVHGEWVQKDPDTAKRLQG